MLPARRGPDDPRAAQARELRRGDADAAAGAVNEHRLSRGKIGETIEREVGGEVVDRNRRRLCVVEAVGNGEGKVRRHDDAIRVAAEAGEGDDAIARAMRRHARSNRIDDARDFVADDDRRLRRVRIESDPREDVGEVDAGRAHRDPDLAVSGRGIRGLAQLQHVGRAVAGDDDLSHGQVVARACRRATAAVYAPFAGVAASKRCTLTPPGIQVNNSWSSGFSKEQVMRKMFAALSFTAFAFALSVPASPPRRR